MLFKKHQDQFSPPLVAAILIAVLSLALSMGVMRWSWLLLGEQVELRKEQQALELRQMQLEVQFEFWNEQLQMEREELNSDE